LCLSVSALAEIREIAASLKNPNTTSKHSQNLFFPNNINISIIISTIHHHHYLRILFIVQTLPPAPKISLQNAENADVRRLDRAKNSPEYKRNWHDSIQGGILT
jgi:hypothetical protein